MTLRTSLARLTRRDPDRPTLRERFAATKAKAADIKERATRAAKVGRIVFAPMPPKPEPINRVALVNYASWLFMERRRACDELYPNAGPRAEDFIAAALAADSFHFPSDGRSWRDVPPPSTRAVRILDLVGVNWRADNVAEHTFDPPFFDAPSPHGWPALDAALLAALADAQRIYAMLDLIPTLDDRDADELPEWRALWDALDEPVGTLTHARAKGLPGLQAKARAILAGGFTNGDEDVLAIARSLAQDLVGATRQHVEPQPDPIHAAIKECRRLVAVVSAAEALPQPVGNLNPLPQQTEAFQALDRHIADVLLKTVPSTARGCVALAQFAAEFSAARGFEFDEDGASHLRTLALIARSPLL